MGNIRKFLNKKQSFDVNPGGRSGEARFRDGQSIGAAIGRDARMQDRRNAGMKRIFPTSRPASDTPRANSSQSRSEFPPLRGDAGTIRTFFQPPICYSTRSERRRISPTPECGDVAAVVIRIPRRSVSSDHAVKEVCFSISYTVIAFCAAGQTA